MQFSYYMLPFKKILATNKKRWCIFIDYVRAYDAVNRDALWAKRISTGFKM